PKAQGNRYGDAILAFCEKRARALGATAVTLYTHVKLTERIAWYARRGFEPTHVEQMPDRAAQHMKKTLG
ncbi:GNAT family N-acetyltransferase, partial [Enterobacter hormaechei]|uniref:GNAT family N-acetyltransferase n=1 Tax=Enterobacter hormaechei TaxID=158836 RepID=UPI0013D3CA42